jgi:hypothetical protein
MKYTSAKGLFPNETPSGRAHCLNFYNVLFFPVKCTFQILSRLHSLFTLKKLEIYKGSKEERNVTGHLLECKIF